MTWLSDFAAFGIIVTDAGLTVIYLNKCFESSLAENDPELVGRNLIEAFPELSHRGFERYYRDALAGQSRILSHRLHGHVFEMNPSVAGSDLPQMPQTTRISPLLLDGLVVGTVSVIEDVSERVMREAKLRFQIEERTRLLESEISARELAEENERLRDASNALRIEGAQLLELGRERDTLMHRIITGQEEERKRIARNIHDHLGQQLTALRFALSFIKQKSTDNDSELSTTIAKAQAIGEKLDRELDYLSWELRPAEIDDIGLEEALKTLIGEWTDHYGIPAVFHCSGLGGCRLGQDIEINLYRIVQEALTNIFKHSRADEAVVSLEKRDSQVVLMIEDNGVGFEADVQRAPSALDSGMGIFGMYERAALVSGTIQIESKPSVGTSVWVTVPVRTDPDVAFRKS